MSDYTKNQDLNREILEWINNRIFSLLEMYIEIGNDDEWEYGYLSICFPRTYIEDNGLNQCLCVLNDLKDILNSNYIRKDLKLLYKYVLIKLVEYYQILYEDAQKCGEYEECEIYFPSMEENLKRKICCEFGENYDKRKMDAIEDSEFVEDSPYMLIYCLEDIDALFWDDVFDDTEIDRDIIDGAVDKNISKIEKGQFTSFDFEYYVDLMSRPTKERYYKIKPLLLKIQEKKMETMAEEISENQINYKIKIFNKESLLQDICTACVTLQGSEKSIINDENSRNTYIRDILSSKGYNVADQSLRGESVSRKQSGEVDLLIMLTTEKPFAIYEALNLRDFSSSGKQYLKSHLNKLLDNYNSMGIQVAYLVSYAKCKKQIFSEFLEQYFKYVDNDLDIECSKKVICEHKLSDNFIKCVEYIYGYGKIYTTVYHIVVRMDE